MRAMGWLACGADRIQAPVCSVAPPPAREPHVVALELSRGLPLDDAVERADVGAAGRA